VTKDVLCVYPTRQPQATQIHHFVSPSTRHDEILHLPPFKDVSDRDARRREGQYAIFLIIKPQTPLRVRIRKMIDISAEKVCQTYTAPRRRYLYPASPPNLTLSSSSSLSPTRVYSSVITVTPSLYPCLTRGRACEPGHPATCQRHPVCVDRRVTSTMRW
jgi:hypothetical protein